MEQYPAWEARHSATACRGMAMCSGGRVTMIEINIIAARVPGGQGGGGAGRKWWGQYKGRSSCVAAGETCQCASRPAAVPQRGELLCCHSLIHRW